MSTRDSFWDIPIIQDAIASHLSQEDLWNCIQSSHDFQNAFIRFLWQSVAPTEDHHMGLFLASPAIPSCRHLVQSLTFNLTYIESVLDHVSSFGPFPNLSHLSFKLNTCPQEGEVSKFFTLAGSHLSTLESLEMYRVDHSLEFLEAFGTFMDKVQTGHHPLRKLDLLLEDNFGSLDLGYIWSRCACLETLVLECGLVAEESQMKQKDIVYQDSRLCHFTFRPPTVTQEGVEKVLAKFLQQNTRLERLDLWSGIEITDTAREIADALQKCFHLKELVLELAYIESFGKFGILESCPRLRRMELCIGEHQEEVIQAVVARHGEIVEELDFFGGLAAISIKSLQMVCCSCPRLRTLRARVKWVDDPEDRTSFWKETPVVGSKWVCTEMRSLDLCFWRQWKDVIEATVVNTLESIFCEVGRLEHLRDLRVDMRNDWKVFPEAFLGCLKRGDLGGLSSLQELYFQMDSSFGFLPEEYELMVRYWPKLVCLVGPSELDNSLKGRRFVSEIKRMRNGKA